MPTFAYQAKQGPTNVVEGTIEAKSQEEVVTRLLQDGLVPVSILIRAGDLQRGAPRGRRERVRANEQRLFTRQLTSLLLTKVEEFWAHQGFWERPLNTGLVYPVLLLLLGLGSLVFFIWVVVPRMAGLFDQLGGALPWPTKALIALSQRLTPSWVWVVEI